MFGCSSSCVAHPNQTSLMKRPPTQYVAEAISHSQRVVVLPAGSWAITPKPRDMARSRPNPRRSGRPLGPVDAGGIGDASQGGFQRADAAALRGPAQRSSPSLPRPNALIPVARAAASPALEAPGVRLRSHGFTVAPPLSVVLIETVGFTCTPVRGWRLPTHERVAPSCTSGHLGKARVSS